MPENKAVRQSVNRITVTIVSTLLVLFALTIVHLYLLDGLDGWLFSQGFTEDTVYAAGYSDAEFRKVRVGMSSDEVLELLGQPIHVSAWNLHRRAGVVAQEEWWSYTRTPSDGNYRQRLICFRDGIVADKKSSYWLD